MPRHGRPLFGQRPENSLPGGIGVHAQGPSHGHLELFARRHDVLAQHMYLKVGPHLFGRAGNR
eukprot:1595917-Lingulodinium_polyedra.AAC.1